MNYPMLQELPWAARTTESFGGLNRQPRPAEGEMAEETNLTSDHYPLLAPRGKRGTYAEPGSAQGLIEKDSLCWVDGSAFVINGYRVEMHLSTAEKDNPKRLVSMGAYVLILPDKKYINTADLSEYGSMEASWQSNGEVRMQLCEADGGEKNISYTGPSEPSDPADGTIWLDTGSKPNVLKVWSGNAGMWASEMTTYVRIEAPGIGLPFAAEDGVRISGLKDHEKEQVAELEGSTIIWAKGDSYIVVTGILDEAVTISTPVKVERRMPAMDFVIESGNRLWGCRYGLDNEGQVVNMLYASKLGDFKNWEYFPGTAMDSYYVNLGSDGVFTGAITHLGYPCFWKENHLHKVYGSVPANFQVQDLVCRGVEKGSEGSLATVNEILYYKGRSGICAYDGALPQEISQVLGTERFRNAVAGSHRNKYYVSMEDELGSRALYVFDTQRGIWHREDDCNPLCFCECRNELYFIDRETGKIRTMLGSGTEDTGPINWEATSWLIGLDKAGAWGGTTAMPEEKYLVKLTVRLSMEKGASLELYAQYDSMGSWKHLTTIRCGTMRSFTIPVRVRRCDHLRLRLKGKGDVRIFSITRWVESSTDRNPAEGQVLDF